MGSQGKWVPPSAGSRLSDLNAYIAAKNLVNKDLKSKYPWDFDGNGNIKSIANRINEDPALVVYTHGIAWVVISRDSVVLSGRQHAAQMAALYTKSDLKVKKTTSAFTIGLIVAPASFLRIQNFRRQLERHAEPASPVDSRFPKEVNIAACDTMTADHTEHCYIAELKPRVMTIAVPGYHIFCGPKDKSEVHQAILQKGKMRKLKDLRQTAYQNGEIQQLVKAESQNHLPR